MENNELYELYYKIALDVAKKQKGTRGAECVDTTFETALEFAKQYKKLSEGNQSNSKPANCAIFDVSERYDLKVGYKDKDGYMKYIVINAEDCDEAYNIFKKQFGDIKVEYID